MCVDVFVYEYLSLSLSLSLSIYIYIYSLRSLNLRDCVSLVNNESVQKIITVIPLIESLSLSGCHRLTDDGMSSFVHGNVSVMTLLFLLLLLLLLLSLSLHSFNYLFFVSRSLSPYTLVTRSIDRCRRSSRSRFLFLAYFVVVASLQLCG